MKTEKNDSTPRQTKAFSSAQKGGVKPSGSPKLDSKGVGPKRVGSKSIGRGTGTSPACDKILALLRSANKPLSAYTILDKMRRQGMRSPPTVYRALEKLMQGGSVHKIESLNAFVACSHGDAPKQTEIDRMMAGEPPVMSRSLFAICTQCGTVKELDDVALYRAIVKAGAPYLKREDHCAVEIAGLCAACAGALGS